MKAAVIYFSLEGNVRYVSEKLAEKLGADTLELRTVKNIAPAGFMKYVAGGKQVLSGKPVELEPYEINLDDYDTLIFGTPVWAGTCTPAVTTFIKREKPEGKKIYLIISSMSGHGDSTANKLRELLAGNEVAGVLNLKSPLKYKNRTNLQIAGFAEKISRENNA